MRGNKNRQVGLELNGLGQLFDLKQSALFHYARLRLTQRAEILQPAANLAGDDGGLIGAFVGLTVLKHRAKLGEG